MERRRFVFLSALGAAALATPGLHCTTPNAALDKTLSIPDMLSHLADEATIREAGVAYGSKMPGEYNVALLEKLLAGNAPNTGSDPSAGISSRLAANIKDGFMRGNTVVVKGWVLSVTEARQCALYTLIKKTN